MGSEMCIRDSTVTGLSTEISYTFEVVATNGQGNSLPSSTSIGITPTVANYQSWEAVASAGSSEWVSVAYGNEVWVAVGHDGPNRVMRSTDNGKTWVLSTPAWADTSNWMSVAYGDGVWIAVAYGGAHRIMRSVDDGATWTSVSAPENNNWWSVAYAEGVWLAVSKNGTNRIMRSVDGLSLIHISEPTRPY